MMKKTMLLTLLGALSWGARAADYNYLVFTLTDGTVQAVTASNLTLAVDNDNLTASSGPTVLYTVALSSLQAMEFSNDGSTTGINTITADTLVSDEATQVYDMGGRLMPRGASLPKGVYIIKNNGKTIKMQIK